MNIWIRKSWNKELISSSLGNNFEAIIVFVNNEI